MRKQTFEGVTAAKKARKKSLTRCDLGDSCVACNSIECGNCKHYLDNILAQRERERELARLTVFSVC